MITVRRGALSEATCEAILRPVRSDLAALTAAGRDVALLAGASVHARLERLGELPVGAAVITPGGDLSAGFLIHVVLESPQEPVTRAGVERALRNGLRRVDEWEIESIALPPVGVGAGQLELEPAIELLLAMLREQMDSSQTLTQVELVVETEYQEEALQRLL